jgi:hypothetical protein
MSDNKAKVKLIEDLLKITGQSGEVHFLSLIEKSEQYLVKLHKVANAL